MNDRVSEFEVCAPFKLIYQIRMPRPVRHVINYNKKSVLIYELFTPYNSEIYFFAFKSAEYINKLYIE